MYFGRETLPENSELNALRLQRRWYMQNKKAILKRFEHGIR